MTGSTITSRTSLLPRVAAGSLAFFALTIVVAGALQPGYSHVSQSISALAAKDAATPWMMVAGFVALGCALVAAGSSLWRSLPRLSARIGAAIVMAGGPGMYAAAFARVDCDEQLPQCPAGEPLNQASAEHMVHNLASLLTFLLLIIALVIIGVGVRRVPGLRRWSSPTFVAALVSFAMIVKFAILDGLPGPGRTPGDHLRLAAVRLARPAVWRGGPPSPRNRMA